MGFSKLNWVNNALIVANIYLACAYNAEVMGFYPYNALFNFTDRNFQ